MCGIVGYIGWREAQQPIIKSLKRLEYRGYDSAGVAILAGKVDVAKAVGKIKALEEVMPRMPGSIGIGHTRWATHGKPSTENAHPLTDCKKQLAVVHNGIIDNYKEIKERLLAEGHTFVSETDTEVISHLVEKHYDGDLEAAVRETVKLLEGSFAVVAIHQGEERIVAARKDSPLIVGIGDGEHIVASDIPAVLDYTDKVIYVKDGEMVVAERGCVRISTFDGEPVSREPDTISWTVEDAEKGGFEHFMLKEIFEQPAAIHASILGRITDLELGTGGRASFNSIKLVACGTSYHASLVGKYVLEELVRVPTSVEMASEYRYSSPARDRPLVVVVTQSGETTDTIAAAREARHRGCRTIAITNVVGSSITREVDSVIYTRAGLEIGVAATKTFTTQIIALYLLALKLGADRRTLRYERIEELRRELRGMPRQVQNVLDKHREIKALADMFEGVHSAFFIGRNINYPIALEGALKLKEISYIHAEGYPAGELKHGPLALLTEQVPTVAIAILDHTYEKMVGNIGEVSARGSPVLAVGFESDRDLEKFSDRVLRVPDVSPLFSPVVVVVALQMLSYHIAKDRGCEIDKPRNLAKSVTVE